jgi:hypothetical protein
LIAQHSFHAQKESQYGNVSRAGRNPNSGFHAISLECRIKINRSCKPANPAFTMSKIREDAQMREARTGMSSKLIVSAVRVAVFDALACQA